DDAPMILAVPSVSAAELGDAALAAAVIALVAVGAGRFAAAASTGVRVARLERMLGVPWAPAAFGLLASLAAWYVGGSLHMLPVIHDEWAYLLQAKIFAGGHLVAPARPLPEFFQQMYVFVTPFLGAKYPPGHSLVLAPGVALGMPALGPIALAGLSGALLFALARRIVNVWIALLAWSIWLTTPATLNWYGSYFSQVTTATCFLAGWWALSRYRDTSSRAAFALFGAAVGLIAITRPLTAVAFALPSGLVALALVRRRARWWDLALPLAASLAVLSVMALQNAAATGSWRESPLMLYTQLYTPFDLPGFGYHFTGTTLPMPPDQEWLRQHFIRLRAEHSLGALPAILAARVGWIVRHMWGGWRLALLPLAVLGLVALPVEAMLALVTSALCLGVMIIHSHDPQWTNYYLELFAPLAFVTALGLWRALAWIAARASRAQRVPAAAPAAATVLAAVFLAWPPLTVFSMAREGHALAERSHREWLARTAMLPRPALVFVRYNYRHHNTNISYVLNTEPDLRAAPVVAVYDRGAENAQLRQLFPGRHAFLFDELANAFVPFAPGVTP
ncbi:MAG: hypothetical protein ABJD07_16835, partial [Gemmatimonadaceae bacterium]